MSDTLNPSFIINPLEELQKQFCLIDIGGEIRIADRSKINKVIEGVELSELSFYTKQHGNTRLRRLLENLPIDCDPKKTIESFWNNPETHVYNQIAFSPLPTPATTLNYWSGPNIKAAKGDSTFITDFLKKIICDNDLNCYAYLIKYLAHMIQRPEEKPGIMIVLLGRQGTGKGMFFNLLRSIWPRTTLQVSDVDSVIGRFNAVLERNFVIQMDEALFNGDKKSMERLKSFITEPKCEIEQKFQPSHTIDSYHRFFAASNNDHFAQVDQDDRRFIFLRVSSSMQGDQNYFNQFAKLLKNEDAIASFLYLLHETNLSQFNVRIRPKTQENLAQKIQSLSGFNRFWYERLIDGVFTIAKIKDSKSIYWSNQLFVKTEDLIQAYKLADTNSEKYRIIQASSISNILNKLCPSAKSGRTSELYSGQRRGYILPDIDVARSAFESWIGGKIDWGHGNPLDIQPIKTGFTEDQLAAMWEAYCLDDPHCHSSQLQTEVLSS